MNLGCHLPDLAKAFKTTLCLPDRQGMEAVRRIAPSLVAAALLVAAGLNPLSSGRTIDASPQASTGGSFALLNELYGDAGAVASNNVSLGLQSGPDFHATMTASEQSFLTTTKRPGAYFSIPSEANVASCYSSATDANTASTLQTITQQTGVRLWRLAMPEFDQGGGCWSTGRPSAAGLSDQAAYDQWTNYYRTTKGLGPYLSQSPAQRGYDMMAVCVFAFCPQYAYDMGVDAVLLERNEDEMSSLTSGLAMLRGAAAQHGGKQWGVDFSTWRYWNNGPTTYSTSGQLVTGWSPSTFTRHLFASYMGGANVVHMEGADYTTGGTNGGLNPLGQAVQRFSNFALTRHPDRGTSYVPVAFMQQHASGFEPKFGEWMQGNSKWYWSNPYSAGDTMLAGLVGAAYPGDSSWGRIAANAPWKVLNADGSINVSATQAAYRAQLASGADPRKWEPMGTTRWGEDINVISDASSAASLAAYKVIVLSTGNPVTSTMLSTLSAWVQAGGILVVNAKQLPSAAESLTGLHLTTTTGTASSSSWTDGSTVSDPSFRYTVATPVGATVLARTTGGDPLVVSQVLGAGRVVTTTPDYMLGSSSGSLLNLGLKTLDQVQNSVSIAKVNGPALQYLVNTNGSQTIVTLINTDLSGAAWNGTITFPQGNGISAREWTTDSAVATTVSGGTVSLQASVPAYDVRVYAYDSGVAPTPVPTSASPTPTTASPTPTTASPTPTTASPTPTTASPTPTTASPTPTTASPSPPPSATDSNLLWASMSSFESAPTGWLVNCDNCTTMVSGVVAATGTHSLLVKATAAGGHVWPATDAATNGASWVPVCPGCRYTLAMSLRPGGTPRPWRLKVIWYSGRNVANLVAVAASRNLGETGGMWTRGSASFKAPAGATYARVSAYIGDDTNQRIAAGEVHFLDNVYFGRT